MHSERLESIRGALGGPNHSKSAKWGPKTIPRRGRYATHQGCPLGPLGFALGIHPVISTLRDTAGLFWQSWYLDDGILLGDVQRVQQALPALEQGMKSVGLSLNLHKCELWGLGAEAWQGPPVKIIPWTPKHGVTILGVPINFPGSTAYSESFWHGLMNTLQAATARVTSQLDPQCAHHLLRKCLDACKVTHLLRATDTYNSLDLGICDEAIWGAFEDLLGCGLNIWQRTQTALPIGVGGCGLRIPSRIRPAARIAALASYLLLWWCGPSRDTRRGTKPEGDLDHACFTGASGHPGL